MMKISVIIICHNNRHIDRVILSALGQLGAGDELFVVDDYSDAETRRLIENIVDHRVNLLTPPKRGNRACNRNFAKERSTGELLVFIDGDVLIGDGSLGRIRSYDFDGISGLCASVAAMRKTPAELAIDLGCYTERIGIDSLSIDKWHEKYPDDRGDKDGSLPWNRFYTAFSVIPRWAYDACGGFDENFPGWGGEDIDLGYRLSKIGALKISPELRAVHIPHGRNIPMEEINGRKNMYYMLGKYRNREMEELLSFALKPYVSDAIDKVKDVMGGLERTDIQSPLGASDILYYPISREDAGGRIVYYENGREISEDFLGLALPFPDSHFELAITTTDLFTYPVGMMTRILQELLRVSDRVKIEKAEPRRISWGKVEDKFKYVFCYYKNYLFADSISDFSIEDGDGFYTVTGR